MNEGECVLTKDNPMAWAHLVTGRVEIWTSEILRSRDVIGLLRRLTGSPQRLSGHDHVPKSWDWGPDPIPSPTEGKKEAIAAASWFMKDLVYGFPRPNPPPLGFVSIKYKWALDIWTHIMASVLINFP